MNTTHNPEFPHHLGSLTKWAGRAALAGALGLAVMGMGAVGMVDADAQRALRGVYDPDPVQIQAVNDSIAFFDARMRTL